jgi:hypothetical protein
MVLPLRPLIREMIMEDTATDAQTEKLLVLFGLDERREPRAARFHIKDQVVVARLALDLGLRVITVTDPQELSIARKVVRGSLRVAERKYIPDISWTLYEGLCEIAGGEIGVICPFRPKRWDDIGPSHVVLAETNPSGGWRPAFVLRRTTNWLVLNWRDRPNRVWFSRQVDAVAILADR